MLKDQMGVGGKPNIIGGGNRITQKLHLYDQERYNREEDVQERATTNINVKNLRFFQGESYIYACTMSFDLKWKY